MITDLPIRKMIILPILLAILAYISGLLNWPFAFVLFFAAFFYVTLSIFLLFFCELMAVPREKRLFTFILALFCLLLFIFARTAISRHYMPGHHGFSALRVSIKFMLLIASAALFWALVKSPKKTIPVICSVLYILFIILAPFVSLLKNTNKDDAAAPRKSLTDTLRTLGYVSWAPVESTEDVGVTIHDTRLTFDGPSLYTTSGPYTYLIDINGNTLNTWKFGSGDYTSSYAEMINNGDLIIYAKDKIFAMLDWDSNVLWQTKMRAHHDFHVAKNGNIYALARRDSVLFVQGMPVPILEDFITVLSPKGDVIKTIPFFDSIKDQYELKKMTKIYEEILNPITIVQMILRKIKGHFLFMGDSPMDIIHSNSIELLDRDIPGLGSAGDILLSAREIDLIAVLDPDKNRLLWSWGPGHISKQHRPTVLTDNNILLFDNGRSSGFSRVIEIDPVTQKIVWSYNSDGTNDFYSSRSGLCQRLPNGNTLITESNGGRAFEISTDGNIVWHYFNPDVSKKNSKRRVIYHMTRITDPEMTQGLKKQLIAPPQ